MLLYAARRHRSRFVKSVRAALKPGLTLLAVLLTLPFPAAALAQASPNSEAAPAAFVDTEQARSDARVAAFNALSESHRTQVQAIVDKFDAGALVFDDAAKQIDAILSADESKALLLQQQQFREKLRQSPPNGDAEGLPPGSSPGSPPVQEYPGGGRPTGGFPGSGPPGSDRPNSGAGGGHFHPDAGQFLLRVAASPQSLGRGEGPP